jgi:hypothetical protein
LLVALSGGAYAALQLPRDSVGNRELKSRAVAVDALRFGLGAKTVVDRNVHRFAPFACPDGAPCVPGPRPLSVQHVTTPARGVLTITAVAEMTITETSERDSQVALSCAVDGEVLDAQAWSLVRSSPQRATQVGFTAATPVPAGKHTVELRLDAVDAPGTLVVEPVTFTFVSAPRLR